MVDGCRLTIRYQHRETLSGNRARTVRTIPSLDRMYTWTPRWQELPAQNARTRSSSEERRLDQLHSLDDMVTTVHERRALVVARSWRRTKSGSLLGWRAVRPYPHDD